MPIVTDTDAATTAAAPPAPAEPAHSVVLDGVTKVYRTGGKPVQALDNVTLKVRPGEFVCLRRRLRVREVDPAEPDRGLDHPTAGTVTSESRPALMFQEPALLPWLTAGHNVELALKYAGVPRRELADRAEALLEVVRLGGTHEAPGARAVRWTAAAGRAGPRARAELSGPADGRTVRGPGRHHPRRAARRADPGLDRDRPASSSSRTTSARPSGSGSGWCCLSSRPGRVVREWAVDIPGHRTIEHPLVGDLASDITVSLREEIARHAGDRNA